MLKRKATCVPRSHQVAKKSVPRADAVLPPTPCSCDYNRDYSFMRCDHCSCGLCGAACKFQQVACGRCDVDYHWTCLLYLSEKDVDGIDEFYCPQCIASDPQLRITYKAAGKRPRGCQLIQ